MSHPRPAGPPHLSDERLAAFDDVPFTVDESAHLAVCATCRAEHEAYTSLRSLAEEAGRWPSAADTPRLVAWESIAEGLRQPHVPTLPHLERAGAERRSRVSWALSPLLRRAAAALLLVTGGALLGRLSSDVTAVRAAVGAIGGSPSVTAVANGETPGTDSFVSVDQATGVLTRAQRDYERASLWLAANDTATHDSDVYRARLAALDQMMAASRAALREAPQDPVLNQYFLAAYTAREATLQALGGALPVDKTIERY